MAILAEQSLEARQDAEHHHVKGHDERGKQQRGVHNGRAHLFHDLIDATEIFADLKQRLSELSGLHASPYHAHIGGVENLGVVGERTVEVAPGFHLRQDVQQSKAQFAPWRLARQTLKSVHKLEIAPHHRRELLGEDKEIGIDAAADHPSPKTLISSEYVVRPSSTSWRPCPIIGTIPDLRASRRKASTSKFSETMSFRISALISSISKTACRPA